MLSRTGGYHTICPKSYAEGYEEPYQAQRDNLPPGLTDSATAGRLDEVLALRDLVQRFHGTTPIGIRAISARRLTVGPQRYERFHGIDVLVPHVLHFAVALVPVRHPRENGDLCGLGPRLRGCNPIPSGESSIAKWPR